MKKLLFILLAFACMAWSDNYGDKGSYGSTAYGEKGYGCSSGYSCSSEKSGAKKAKKSGKSTPSSSSSSTTLGSLLGNLMPTANSASSASGTPAAKPAKKEPEPLKPYKYRLVFDLSGVFYDADLNFSSPLGVGANAQFLRRWGEGKFFAEYGLSAGFATWTYIDGYYEETWDWTVFNVDALLQGGMQFGQLVFRFGGYGGYLLDNDARYGRHDDHMLQNPYRYGVTLGASYYFSRVELGVVVRDDLSEINPDIGNMKYGKRGFVSGGLSVGFVF